MGVGAGSALRMTKLTCLDTPWIISLSSGTTPVPNPRLEEGPGQLPRGREVRLLLSCLCHRSWHEQLLFAPEASNCIHSGLSLATRAPEGPTLKKAQEKESQLTLYFKQHPPNLATLTGKDLHSASSKAIAKAGQRRAEAGPFSSMNLGYHHFAFYLLIPPSPRGTYTEVHVHFILL